jgi:hypothetical protein
MNMPTRPLLGITHQGGPAGLEDRTAPGLEGPGPLPL